MSEQTGPAEPANNNLYIEEAVTEIANALMRLWHRSWEPRRDALIAAGVTPLYLAAVDAHMRKAMMEFVGEMALHHARRLDKAGTPWRKPPTTKH